MLRSTAKVLKLSVAPASVLLIGCEVYWVAQQNIVGRDEAHAGADELLKGTPG